MIFYIAEAAKWEAALQEGDYRISTRGRTLDEEGFIHASHHDQVQGVAEAFPHIFGPINLDAVVAVTPLELPFP